MKIHITENIDKALENYVVVPILYGKIDMSFATDNSVTHIIAIDALDSIPCKLLIDFIKSLVQKMRLGCEIILGGTELSAISKDMITNKINTLEYNELIFGKRGLYRSSDIVNLLNQAGLIIHDIQIKGNKYELTAVRPYNKN